MKEQHANEKQKNSPQETQKTLKISPVSLCDKTMNLRQFPTESATSGVRMVEENPHFPTDEQSAPGPISKPLQASVPSVMKCG